MPPDIVHIRTENSGEIVRLLLLDQRAPLGCVDPTTLPLGCKVELTYKKVFNYILTINPLEPFEAVTRREAPKPKKEKGLLRSWRNK